MKSTVTTVKIGKLREDCRYFITPLTDIQSFAAAVRSHWSIENQLHWQLNVLFHEDACRAHRDNSPLNLNILRKEALRRLKQTDMGTRDSLHRKMSRASMNNGALAAVLTAE